MAPPATATRPKPPAPSLPLVAAVKVVAVVVAVCAGILVSIAAYRRASTPSYVPQLPWICEVVNSMQYFGVTLGPELTPRGLETAAIALTGGRHSDFGYERDGRVEEILADFALGLQRANMSNIGRMMITDYVVHMLANRLQRTAVLSNPTHVAEIHAQRIDRPVVVLGLFRSGTTALHRILSAMPTLRGIKYYELMYFAGLHGHNVSAGAYADRSQDPRLPVVEAQVNQRDTLGSEVVERMHKVAANEAEECAYITDTTDFQMAASVTGVGTVLALDDRPPSSYPDLLEGVQMSQWLAPFHGEERRWLFKSPTHVGALNDVLGIYPDASLVWIYRPPVQQFASRLSMLSTIWHLLLEPDADRITRIRSYLFSRLLEMAHAGVDQFRALPAAQQAQFVFVNYTDFVRDPVEESCKIAEDVGEACVSEASSSHPTPARRALEEHARLNPRHKHGKHSYSLADFGTTAAQVQEAFQFYTDFFREQLAAQAARRAGSTQ